MRSICFCCGHFCCSQSPSPSPMSTPKQVLLWSKINTNTANYAVLHSTMEPVRLIETPNMTKPYCVSLHCWIWSECSFCFAHQLSCCDLLPVWYQCFKANAVTTVLFYCLNGDSFLNYAWRLFVSMLQWNQTHLQMSKLSQRRVFLLPFS